MFQAGGLGSALATGAAFGAGSAIAHQALGGMFGHHYGGYGGGGYGAGMYGGGMGMYGGGMYGMHN